jgi:hypothetical protein
VEAAEDRDLVDAGALRDGASGRRLVAALGEQVGGSRHDRLTGLSFRCCHLL